MKISRKDLKRIVEELLQQEEDKNVDSAWICPKCGHEHDHEPGDKCENCGHDYDDSWQGKEWVKPKKKINEQKEETPCPTATTDISVNTANRDRARSLDWIMYGPLNVEEPGDYWKRIADKWNTLVEAAKKSRCSNCIAFDISPRMIDKCIPAVTSEPVEDEFGILGYCWMHQFKCHSARSCNTWAAGGPINKDKVSYDWQKRNLKAALNPEPIDPDLYKDD